MMSRHYLRASCFCNPNSANTEEFMNILAVICFYGGVTYRISSYKALPRMIPATLIIPAILTILCSGNVVFSNKTRIWRLCKIIIPAGLIWGNTVVCCGHPQNIYFMLNSTTTVHCARARIGYPRVIPGPEPEFGYGLVWVCL